MKRSVNPYLGFTLIELSIVLVIIGLIVGGVLVGRTLIKSAEARSQIKQAQDMQTQVATFLGKYECLPGDCSKSVAFLGSTDSLGRTITDGDGDGLIQTRVGSGAPYPTGQCLQGNITDEITQLFLHLNAAKIGSYKSDGITNVVGVGYPYAAINNGTGIFISCLSVVSYPVMMPASISAGNGIFIGVGNTTTRVGYSIGYYGLHSYGQYGLLAPGILISPMGISSESAQSIDRKIDDGKPNTGSFAVYVSSAECAIEGAGDNAVYPSTPNNCSVTAVLKLGH